MSNQIIFSGTTLEQLVGLIKEDHKTQLQELKNSLCGQSANEELLTREQTCKFLKINSSTLWAWSNKGKVTAYGIGSRRYYKRSELMDSLIKLKK